MTQRRIPMLAASVASIAACFVMVVAPAANASQDPCKTASDFNASGGNVGSFTTDKGPAPANASCPAPAPPAPAAPVAPPPAAAAAVPEPAPVVVPNPPVAPSSTTVTEVIVPGGQPVEVTAAPIKAPKPHVAHRPSAKPKQDKPASSVQRSKPTPAKVEQPEPPAVADGQVQASIPEACSPTGSSSWIFALLAGLAIGIGFTMWRRKKTPAEEPVTAA